MDFNPIKVSNDNFPIEKLVSDIRTSITPSKQNTELSDILSTVDTGNKNIIGGVGIQPIKQKFSMEEKIPIEETHALVGDTWMSKYPTFKLGRDNAEFAAQNQSGLEQAFNGTLKAVSNIGNVIVGNTAGFVYGLTDWARTGNFNSVFDNSFSRTLDEWNKKLNYQLPNYYTKQAQNSGFLGQLIENPINTIFNDIANGVSFTVGTVVSEAIWAYATGGASLAMRGGQLGAKLANAGKWGKMFLGAEKAVDSLKTYKGFMAEPLKNAIRTGQISTKAAKGLAFGGNLINTTRFIATSSGNEAGIEAFHFKKEAEENFYHNFEQMYGRPPEAEEIATAQKDIEQAANGVFMGNMAILGVSNLAMLGGLFGIKSPMSSIQKQINKNVFGVGMNKTAEGWKAVAPTKWNKVARALYIPTSATIREGVFEEAGQGTVTKTANLWVERKYDPKYIGKAIDMMEIAGEAAREQYLTKEGQKDIWIGGIVGILGGKITGEFSRFKREQKNIEDSAVKAMNTVENLKTTLVSDITAGRLSAVAVQLEAQDRAERKMLEGDVVQAKLAQYDGLLAGFMFSDTYDDSSRLVEDLSMAIDVSQDISAEEKETFKTALTDLHKTYKKATSFAESIVGSQGRIYGTNKSTQLAKEALTFVLVQGNNANKLMNESFEEMKAYMSADQSKAFEQSESLSTLGIEARKKFTTASKRYRELDKKSKEVQEKVQELQVAPKEIEGDKQSKLVKMQTLLLKLEKQKLEIRGEIEDFAKQLEQTNKLKSTLDDTLSSEVDTAGAFISTDDLLKLDQRLEDLESSYKAMENFSPTNAKMLNDAMQRYQNAKKSLLDYNSAAGVIAKGKYKPRLANDNIFSNLFTKKDSEKADDYTIEFFNALEANRAKKGVELMDISQEADVKKLQARVDEITEGKEDLTEEEKIELKNLLEQITELQKPVQSVEEKDDKPSKEKAIQKRVERLNTQLDELQKELDNTEEVIDEQPNPRIKELKTQIANVKKEITKLSPQIENQPLDTVEALKQRIENILKLFKAEFVGMDDIDERIKNKPDQKDIERYRELRDLYDNIQRNIGKQKTFDISLLSEKDQKLVTEFQALKEKLSQWRVYDSLAVNDNESIADLLDQVASLEAQVEELETVEVSPEFDKESDLDTNKSGKVDNFQLTQNTNFPPTLKVNKNGVLSLTHLNPSTILSKFQNPKDIKINGEDGNLEDIKMGDVITFDDNGLLRKMTIGVGMSIEMAKEDFVAASNLITTNKLTSEIVNWSYPVLYEENAVEDVVPLKSDFYDDFVLGHTNDLKEGDTIELFVDVNHPHNKKLIGLNDSVKTLNEVVIFIRKGGKNYQTLKALSGRASNDIIKTIRKAAAKQLGTGKSGQIGTTKIERVELGVPILTITKNNEITTKPITKVGLENIKATGYIQNGEITLNKKIDNVRKSYVSKSSINNKDKKIPIVVLQQGAQLIAFPIKLIKTSNPQGDKMQDIFNNENLNDAQKAVEINKLLVENNISPRRFDLVAEDIANPEKLQDIENVLNNVKSFKSANDLADSNYKIENLENDAEISLDLENLNVYLPSQKLLISFDDLNLSKEKPLKQEVEDSKEVNKEVVNDNLSSKLGNENLSFILTENTIQEILKSPKLSAIFSTRTLNNIKNGKIKPNEVFVAKIKDNQVENAKNYLSAFYKGRKATYTAEIKITTTNKGNNLSVDTKEGKEKAKKQKDVKGISEQQTFKTVNVNDENIEEVVKVDDLPSISVLKDIAKKMKYNKDNFDLLSDEDRLIWAKDTGSVNKIIDDYNAEQRKNKEKSTSSIEIKKPTQGITIDGVLYTKTEKEKGAVIWYERLPTRNDEVVSKGHRYYDILGELDKTEYTFSEIQSILYKKDKTKDVQFSMVSRDENHTSKRSFFRRLGKWTETVGFGRDVNSVPMEGGFMNWLYNQFLEGKDMNPKLFDSYKDTYTKLKDIEKTEQDSSCPS